MGGGHYRSKQPNAGINLGSGGTFNIAAKLVHALPMDCAAQHHHDNDISSTKTHKRSLLQSMPYQHGRGMLAIRPVGRFMRKSRHLQVLRLSRNNAIGFSHSVVVTHPIAFKCRVVWVFLKGMNTRSFVSHQSCDTREGLRHALHTTGTAYIHRKPRYGF